MNSARREPPGPVRCVATTSLAPMEEAKLAVASGRTTATDAPLFCEIVGGHEGSHIAFATLSEDDEQWWWFYWNGPAREIRQIDLCGVCCLDGPYVDECLLLEGHPGPHSYRLHSA